MANSKDAASVTDTPKGLDVAITVPGTIVGSHDLQGTDGTTRTDRPGELLGTPVATNEARTAGHAREAAKHDYVTAEVDRANREELPRLGGTTDDGWEPGDSKGSKARTAQLAPAASRGAIAPVAPVAKAPTAPAAHDSGIVVSPKIDRG